MAKVFDLGIDKEGYPFVCVQHEEEDEIWFSISRLNWRHGISTIEFINLADLSKYYNEHLAND